MKLPRGRKNWPPKVCPQCGETFGPKPGHGAKDWRTVVFCSRACSSKSRAIVLVDRLLANATEDSVTGCFEWTKGLDRKGYGRIGVNPFSREVLVHRIAWELAYGPVPGGLHVLHHCDNRRCFNLAHLFLGTNDDNVADRVSKGRDRPRRGEDNGRARVPASAIPSIRADRRRAADIAIEYGVNATTINNIRSGKTWRHV